MRKMYWFGTAGAMALTGTLAFAVMAPEPLYTGSSFNEVLQVIASPLQIESSDARASEAAEDSKSYGTSENPQIPHYKLSLLSVVNGDLLAAARRTFASHVDYLPYFKKIVHANGICMVGTWEMTEPSIYTGYFSKGSRGFFLGRASTAAPDTVRGKDRAFGLAGKIFPSEDPNESVKTANFFLVDNLNGTQAPHYLDVSMTNEPNVKSSVALDLIQFIFERADKKANQRPLYPIARLGRTPGDVAVAPRWMMARIARDVQDQNVNDPDFRDELSMKNYPHGLVFDVLVSETTKDANQESGWQKLGQIRVQKTLVSVGCDRRLVFSHPRLTDPEHAPISPPVSK